MTFAAFLKSQGVKLGKLYRCSHKGCIANWYGNNLNANATIPAHRNYWDGPLCPGSNLEPAKR